jgi:hypothetical protein
MRLSLIIMSALLLFTGTAPAQDGPKDYSAAERLLFMDYQLGNVKAPTTLRYSFRTASALEPGYEDKIALALKTGVDGSCCATHTDFLTGDHHLALPDLPVAEGNPVILHFLEREVREMQRLTKGSQTHFRKRIRMAVYQAASVTPVTVRFKGRSVAGQEVRIAPYLDDPNRPRYEQLARKEYRFILSPSVPGNLYGIHTRVASAQDGAAPLLEEALYIYGAEPTPHGNAK